MAIVISGVNNNDKITAADGTIDLLSGVNLAGILTAPAFSATGNITAGHLNIGSGIQLGNAGVATATTFVGNLTGNVNATSNLLLQIGGSEKFRVGSSGQLGIGGANYGTSGQVLTSGGSGSAATWSTVSGTTINNNADNRLITGSGTANTLEGEVNLTWNGQTFEAYNLSGPSYIAAKSNTNSGDYGIVQVQSGSTVRGRLVSDASVDAFRLDTAGRASAPFTFHTGSSYTERVRITSNGGVVVSKGGSNAFSTGLISALDVRAPEGTKQLVVSNSTYEAGPYDNEAGIWFKGNYSGDNERAKSAIIHKNIGDYGVGGLHFCVDNGYDNQNASYADRKMSITKEGYVTKPGTPSFAAYRSQNDYTLNNSIFTFNAIRHNIGGHFSTSTHRFTAPVDGRYLFTFWAIYNTNVNNAYYTIRINGSAGSGMYNHFTKQHSSWDHVSSNYIFDLTQNDYVDMFSNSNVNWHGNSWQLFCGYLLG